MINSDTSTPWYRQFWPWFIISIPLSSVIGGIFMIWIATRHDTGLVTDNYYQRGLEINRQLQLDQAAQVAEVSATLTFNEPQRQLTLQLAGNIPSPKTLHLTLESPLDPAKDLGFQLSHSGDQRYQSAMPTLPQGRFYLRLTPETRTWRLKDQLVLPLTGAITIPQARHSKQD